MLKVVDGNHYKLKQINAPGIEVWHICTVEKHSSITKGCRTFMLIKILTNKILEKWYLNELVDGQLEVVSDDEEFREVAVFINMYQEDLQGWKWNDLPV